MESIIVGMFDENDEALALVNDLEARGVPQEKISVEAGKDAPARKDRTFFEKVGDVLSGRDKHAFSEAVRRGSTVVSARVDDPLVDETVDLMKSHGAVDIDERAEKWRSEGWKEGSTGLTEEQRLPVVEEELKVGKRGVLRGGVRIYSKVSERPVEEQVNLREERVTVDRRPVDRPVSGDEPGLFQEGSFEVVERGEEAVVGKESRVVEEVVVGKQVTGRTESVKDTVRRTDVEVEDIGGGPFRSGTDDFDRVTPEFEQHYRTTYASSGYPYDQYAPAYRHGWQLASRDEYRGRSWNEVESEAQRSWETQQPGTWARFKDAIRYGWDRMTGKDRTY